MFRVTKGKSRVSRASVGDLDVLFHDLWKRVQHCFPQLIPDTIKVEEAYSVRQSLQRGATTEAQNRAIPTDVLEANNRWRKHLRGRGILPTMSMVERYTDAKALVEALVRFSELMGRRKSYDDEERMARYEGNDQHGVKTRPYYLVVRPGRLLLSA